VGLCPIFRYALQGGQVLIALSLNSQGMVTLRGPTARAANRPLWDASLKSQKELHMAVLGNKEVQGKTAKKRYIGRHIGYSIWPSLMLYNQQDDGSHHLHSYLSR
jgi:hypothetical protein